MAQHETDRENEKSVKKEETQITKNKQIHLNVQSRRLNTEGLKTVSKSHL